MDMIPFLSPESQQPLLFFEQCSGFWTRSEIWNASHARFFPCINRFTHGVCIGHPTLDVRSVAVLVRFLDR